MSVPSDPLEALAEINSVRHVSNSIKAGGFAGWHKEEGIHYWPRRDLNIENLPTLARDMFDSLSPANPVFDKSSQIMTMGSCFAARLRAWIRSHQRAAETVFVPEGLNNSFAVRQFVEWSLTGNKSTDAYWYDQGEDGTAQLWTSHEEQRTVCEKFKSYSGFVLTLGLSEVWRDRETGGVFWRGVPERIFDPQRHECVVSTVEENTKNLLMIIRLLREHCGDKPIIVTLSPVPLNATFLGRSCVVSDCASKSILRAAIETVCQQTSPKDNVYYWPSFEFVRWLSGHVPLAFYGGDLKADGVSVTDNMHVSEWVVRIIVENFVRRFFKPD
jgi:hypothetical protein